MITGRELFEQLDWHWTNQLRPRIDSLGDDEYLWEPVPGCWSVRMVDGRPEADWPVPEPPPVTTIAWRMSHLIGGVLGFRANWHFGDRSASWDTFRAAGTAAEGLTSLDAAFDAWRVGVLGAPDGFFQSKSQGPEGTLDADFPFAQVVLHINREVIHHGAEIALLRDLYAASQARPLSTEVPTG